MSTSDDIKIHKTLHHRDAFVQSVDYTALSAPVLTQTITVDGKISVGSEGKTLVRRSEDNGGTWCETGEWHASLSKTVRRYKPMYLCVPEQGALLDVRASQQPRRRFAARDLHSHTFERVLPTTHL